MKEYYGAKEEFGMNASNPNAWIFGFVIIYLGHRSGRKKTTETPG